MTIWRRSLTRTMGDDFSSVYASRPPLYRSAVLTRLDRERRAKLRDRIMQAITGGMIAGFARRTGGALRHFWPLLFAHFSGHRHCPRFYGS